MLASSRAGGAPLIVAAVDLDEWLGAVAFEAGRLALALGAPWVVVLHVVDTSRLPAAPDTPEGRAALGELRGRGLAALEEAVGLLDSMGVEGVAVAREGRPCSEIVGLARDAGAGFLVVGRGRGGAGGTARCVLTHWRGHLLVAAEEGVEGHAYAEDGGDG